jgi:hypothetical protein
MCKQTMAVFTAKDIKRTALSPVECAAMNLAADAALSVSWEDLVDDNHFAAVVAAARSFCWRDSTIRCGHILGGLTR